MYIGTPLTHYNLQPSCPLPFLPGACGADWWILLSDWVLMWLLVYAIIRTTKRIELPCKTGPLENQRQVIINEKLDIKIEKFLVSNCRHFSSFVVRFCCATYAQRGGPGCLDNNVHLRNQFDCQRPIHLL